MNNYHNYLMVISIMVLQKNTIDVKTHGILLRY